MAVCSWVYEPPYDIYSVDLAEAASLTDPHKAYFSIRDERGGLVGYCCFGTSAQVPGGGYDNPALDIGLGMRPDLTGKGTGLALVTAILDVARQRIGARHFRLTVAAFNRRAIAV